MSNALSQFPAMHKGELTYGPDARGMSTAATLSVEPLLGQQTVDVEIVVPVYNEEDDLAVSISRLHTYLSRNFPLSWLITVADNASTDSTWAIACRLARELDGVRAQRLAEKGRGRALRAAWSGSKASVVAYMDVDLSTDLDALLPLVAPLISGHSDVAIGSRLAHGARVVRGAKREFISRTYNLILRATLRNSFSDAQCGFKAMRAEAARRLLPLVEDNAWFFDTELLVLAERSGLRVHEVAVDWVDDPGSTVDIVRTARDDLKGIARMMRTGWRRKGDRTGRPGEITGERDINGERGANEVRRINGERGPIFNATGELVHFASVSAVSTVAFAVLFLLFYGPLGAVAANVVALGLCALGHLVAGRPSDLSPPAISGGRSDASRVWAFPIWAGILWAVLPLASTVAALAVISAAGAGSLPFDIVVLTLALLGCATARFCFLRQSLGMAG
jgi:Glycosyl transferase family 2